MRPTDPPNLIVEHGETWLASRDPAEGAGAFRALREALDAEKVPDRDPRRVATDLVLARMWSASGRTGPAREAASRALATARELGDVTLVGLSMAALAEALAAGSDPRGADALFRRALAESPEGARSRTWARLHLAESARDRGRWADAEQFMVDALAEALPGDPANAVLHAVLGDVRDLLGDPQGAARELERARAAVDPERRLDLASVHDAFASRALRAGDLAAALSASAEAMTLVRDTGGLRPALIANVRGDVLRRAGDPEGALEAYELARRLLEAINHRKVALVRLNLVLTLLLVGREDEARTLFRRTRDLGEFGWHSLTGTFVELLGAAIAAIDGDRAGWGRHHDRAAARLPALGGTHADLAQALRVAGRAWAASVDRADRSRAFRARALALVQWERLGDGTEAETERAALAALGRSGVPATAGPFDLMEPIGQGAMGEVWRAVHHVRGTEVAVKLLRAGSDDDELVRSSLDGEVRAVAALDHPGIVRLLGHGLLEPTVQYAGERWKGGAPWFAMELGRGGTLREVTGRLRWSQCRGVLAQLLDALAHAHAREVLHLDLKPANVLLDRDPQGLVARLTDFGLAGLSATVARTGRTVGTPQYMAPEQFRGAIEDLGPWTDLYALGCVAWELVTGGPPFPGEAAAPLRHAHLGLPPPPLRARVPVPDGFEDWLRRLLSKATTDRFAVAADAAWALSRLPDPADDPAPEGVADLPPAASSPSTFTLPSWDSLDSAEIVEPAERVVADLPPMPVSWRGPIAPRPVGLQALDLFGLRRPPLVGRERERSLLWATLADVRRRAHPRMLALEGAPGTGRSALARWLLELARERGVAFALHAEAGPGRDALRTLALRALDCGGLEGDARRRRLEVRAPPSLGAAERAALARLLDGELLEPEEIVPAACRLLEALARVRPLVVWLEGQPARDPAATGLAKELVSGDAPVLVVVEGGPGEDREADRRWEALLDLPPTMAVGLEPPSADVVRRLVRELLPLAPDLTDAVVERAGGDLHLAVALLEDLVDRDALLDGPEGLALRGDARLLLPAGLEQAWAERLERALEGMPDVARQALATCAIGDTEIPADAWRVLCEALAVPSPSRLTRRLRSARLIVPAADRGFVFAHRGIAALLREQVAAEGALPALSALAARHLPIRDPARLGQVLLDAGATRDAIEPLSRGAREALARGDATSLEALLGSLSEALRSDGTPEDDPAWLPVLTLHARLWLLQGDPEAALPWAARAAAAEGDPATRLGPLRTLARVQEALGDGAGAVATWKEALKLARRSALPIEIARILLALGEDARLRGDLEGAARHFERGTRSLEGESAAALSASLGMGLGLVEAARGELEAADRQLRASLEGLERAGDARRAILCRGALGRVACLRGDARAADRWFDEAIGAVPHTERGRRAELRLDRCLIPATRGHWERLDRELEAALADHPAPTHRVSAWAATLRVASVATGPDAAFADALDALDEGLKASGLCAAEVARILELGAERAARTRPERARAMLSRASRQWYTLGARDDAQRARERARAL